MFVRRGMRVRRWWTRRRESRAHGSAVPAGHEAAPEAGPTSGEPRAQGQPAPADLGLVERVPAKRRWNASPRAAGRRERWSARWRWFVWGARPEPIPSYRETVEDSRPGKTGICCSGGGIRSAAFNLGALQVLYDRKVLQGADYLAAV